MYRLLQGSRVVSKNIVDVFKQNGCEAVVFAGDVVEKSIIRPYVQAEVKYFLDYIMSNFKGGWIIWGNHDLDSKSADQTVNDAVLGVILPPNLTYAHKQIVNINGTTIAFSNWQPEFDLSWIQSPVDFLITHARINYQGGGNYQSQKLDESKFNLAICGDIHTHGAKGKYVSIGVPQMCKMSDSPVATGIILDTDTKQYRWVDLNPYDNLIKFTYTDQLDWDNKWDKLTHTYYVYKRPDVIDPVTGVSVSVPAWAEVQELVDSAIVSNNLQNVHNEVLKYVDKYDYQDVDFNFTLTKFSCKNWRSIDDCTMYFNEGDKILIQGANGSGKSSLLTAIKYAFVDVSDTKGLSSLKPFIQFGSKECWTEVEFVYQNNLCRIRRGTKECGLWINNEQMKYNDKKSFEADVRARFPFIKYMDIFFLDSDHNQLIGGMTVEKKSLIISKVLKLSKIDMFNDIANNILSDVKKSGNDIVTQINEKKEVLKFIDAKLSTVQLPTIPLDQLQAAKNEGEMIERENKAWLNYLNTVNPLHTELNYLSEEKKRLENRKNQFRPIADIDNEILSLQNQLNDVQGKMIELNNLKTTIEFKEAEENRLKDEGNKAYIDAKNINLNGKCSLCGQSITTPDSVRKHKQELQRKVEEIKGKITVLREEIIGLKQTFCQSNGIYMQLNAQLENLNNAISDLKAEKRKQEDTMKDLDLNYKKYQQIQQKLSSIPAVKQVDLPADFIQKMNEINIGISAWTNYNELTADKAAKTAEIENLSLGLNKLSNISTELDRYIKLTGPAGEVYSVILNKLASEFSDNLVKYEVRKYTCRGEHLNLESMYYNNGHWIDYEACSSGQKTVLDVNFLQKIIPRIGLLIMDEFFKHLDPENHDLCIEMLNGMNIGCTMISSHMESIAAFNNKSCKLSLNESGLTQIDFK
jgi:DNA repair exonuclease SbcCD ATPase subunit/predicted phosphodiesterase